MQDSEYTYTKNLFIVYLNFRLTGVMYFIWQPYSLNCSERVLRPSLAVRAQPQILVPTIYKEEQRPISQ